MRLIGGGAELLLGMCIIEKLRVLVDFGMRSFHVWKGERGAMARNGGIRRVYPLAPTARFYTKLGWVGWWGDILRKCKIAIYTFYRHRRISGVFRALGKFQLRNNKGRK